MDRGSRSDQPGSKGRYRRFPCGGMSDRTMELDTREEALDINLDAGRYGTFAEIGAGQEVVCWFFGVGSAAGTVTKSMSAYDMSVSYEIYGDAKRYDSRERLEAMLEHEHQLNRERLDKERGASERPAASDVGLPPSNSRLRLTVYGNLGGCGRCESRSFNCDPTNRIRRAVMPLVCIRPR